MSEQEFTMPLKTIATIAIKKEKSLMAFHCQHAKSFEGSFKKG